MKYSEKNEFIIETWGGPGVPLLNFEGGPGVPLLNFRGSRIPGSRGRGSRGPGPTFTPCLFYCKFAKIFENILFIEHLRAIVWVSF